MKIRHDLSAQLLPDATELFWEAFGSKFRRPLGKSDQRSREFLAKCFDPANVALAVEGDQVLGFMGFSDRDHPMKADEWSAARSVYGFWGGLWRLTLLAPLAVKPPEGALYIEWIAVSSKARSRGIGSQLMSYAEGIARERHLTKMSLDVVDSNPRAQALYIDLGYKVTTTKSVAPFGRLYGFARYTMMEKSLD